MRQLTLRQIPDLVEIGLRNLAKQRGQSLNKTAIFLLKKVLGLEKMDKKQRDLSKLTGKWSEQEAENFNKNIEIFEQIDEEMW